MMGQSCRPLQLNTMLVVFLQSRMMHVNLKLSCMETGLRLSVQTLSLSTYTSGFLSVTKRAGCRALDLFLAAFGRHRKDVVRVSRK